MSAIHSYLPVLTEACKYLQPKQILEWGPGKSTQVISELCPDGHIISIEHDIDWWDKTTEMLRRHNIKNVELHLELWGKPFGNSGNYVTYPLLRNAIGPPIIYDLIFVDGRSRADCLMVARQLISTYGLVILHDSDRVAYYRSLHTFPFLHHVKSLGTSVASKSQLNWLKLQ